MNQRTFSSPATHDFGRVLLGSTLNSGTLNVTTSGLHAVTADSTLAAYSGSAINGLSASGAATLADGSSSPFNIGRTISGTLSGTAGTLTGTFNMDATDEFSNVISNAANVSYTVNGVNQRTFSSPATYDFGRVLLGSTLNSGTLNVTTSGLHAVTADSTLAAYAGSAINGLSASGAATLADGSSSPFNIGRTISGTLSGTAGTLTGTFNMDATDEFSNVNSNAANVSYTANGVNQRTITDGLSTSLGRVLNGVTVNVISNAFTTIGLNATTTSVQVAGNPVFGSPDANGITLSGSATNFTGLVLNDSATRSFGGTFTGTGVQSGSFTLGVTTLENGGLGLTGETAYSNVTVAYTANVLNQSTFSSPVTYDFGRVLLGSTLNSGTLNVTTSGLHAVTADSTLAAYAGSAINGLSASGAATLADGSSSPFNIGRTISGTLSGTAGTLTGTFNMDATDEFSNVISNAANVSYTVNGVNQRTFSSPSTYDFGRVLLGSSLNSGTLNVTTSGLHAVTADSTLAAYAGSAINGLSASGAATLADGSSSPFNIGRTISGTLSGTAGTLTGTFNMDATDEFSNVISNAANVSYTVNGVNQRTFSSPATYDFGRVLLGSSLNSGTLNVTTSGLHAVTADSTLAAYSGSAINGLSASGAATLADGSSSPFNIGRTISGTLSGTAGTLTGTFNMDATDEFSNVTAMRRT